MCTLSTRTVLCLSSLNSSAIQPGPATLGNGIQCPLRDKIILRLPVSNKAFTGNIKDGGLEGTPQLVKIPQKYPDLPNPHSACSQTPQHNIFGSDSDSTDRYVVYHSSYCKISNMNPTREWIIGGSCQPKAAMAFGSQDGLDLEVCTLISKLSSLCLNLDPPTV